MLHCHQILTESQKDPWGCFCLGWEKSFSYVFPSIPAGHLVLSFFSLTSVLSFLFFPFFKNNSTTVIIFIIFNHLTKCAEWRSHMTSCLKLIWPSKVMALTNFYWQVPWLYYSGDSLFLFLKERVNKREWAFLKIKEKERTGRLYPPISRLEQKFSLSHPVLLLFSVSL